MTRDEALNAVARESRREARRKAHQAMLEANPTLWGLAKIAAAVLLMLSLGWATRACADEWTPTDTAFELAGATLHLADWSQTLAIARNARMHRIGVEGNPLLGEVPSNRTVNAYFAGTLVLHAAIAYVLPQPYRRIWQVAWIGLGGFAVGSNLALGVRFDLP